MIFFLMAVGVATILSSVCNMLFPRQQWHVRHFLSETDGVPYLTESFACREHLETAVALCVRQGSDDVLKITGPGF